MVVVIMHLSHDSVMRPGALNWEPDRSLGFGPSTNLLCSLRQVTSLSGPPSFSIFNKGNSLMTFCDPFHL